MGLLIKVYSDIIKSEEGKSFDFVSFAPIKRWEDRVKNIEKDTNYNGIQQICFYYDHRTHNEFRNKLAKMIAAKEHWIRIDDKTIPFAYLFDFSDKHGCFDWEISKILYKNFKDFKKKAKLYSKLYDDTLFLEHYNKWLALLKIAKNKGVVVYSSNIK